MKKLLTSICLSLALITAPIAFNGCQVFQQKPVGTISASASDQIILRAEQTAQTAKATFTTFVHLERDNEAVLKQVNPSIHAFSNVVRAHGIDWIKSLRTATKAYKSNRTTGNQANLNTALATLNSFVAEANKYLTQSKSAVGQ